MILVLDLGPHPELIALKAAVCITNKTPFSIMNKFLFFVFQFKKYLLLFFRGSVTESTTLPITLIREQCQSEMGNCKKK